MLMLIDNYDSFTFNLYHFLGDVGARVRSVAKRQDQRAGRDGARTGGDRVVAWAVHPE